MRFAFALWLHRPSACTPSGAGAACDSWKKVQVVAVAEVVVELEGQAVQVSRGLRAADPLRAAVHPSAAWRSQLPVLV